MTKPQDAAGLTIGVQTGTVQETWVLENLVPLGTTEDQIFRYDTRRPGRPGCQEWPHPGVVH